VQIVSSFKERIRDLTRLGLQETLDNGRLGIEKGRLPLIFFPQLVSRACSTF
jgi:hypothetical protein